MTGPNMTGIWTFYGKPVKDGQAGSGQIDVTLRQHGTDLTGQIYPEARSLDSSLAARPGGDPCLGAWQSVGLGEAACNRAQV